MGNTKPSGKAIGVSEGVSVSRVGMYRAFVGIDPGSSSGAISIKRDDRVEVHRLRNDCFALRELLLDRVNPEDTLVGLERVWGRVGESRVASDAFARNHEMVKTVCRLCGYDLINPVPQRWQGGLGLRRGKMEQEKWKGHLADAARRLAKKRNLKLHKYAADSYLIMCWTELVVSTQVYEQYENIERNYAVNDATLF